MASLSILIGPNQCGPPSDKPVLFLHLMTVLVSNFNGIYGILNKFSVKLNYFDFDKFLQFLTIADNKDKLLKVLQYIVKLIIVTRGKNLIKPVNSTAADLKHFASTLSLSRKLGRLGNWIPGLQDLYELSSAGSINSDHVLKVIGTSASLGNDLLDDWICLQKGRLLLKQPYLDTLDLWSTRLWFVSVSIDLNFTIKKLSKLKNEEIQDYHKKRMDLLLTASKQICDWTFCLWELANLSKYNEHVPVFAGLSAALIGAIRGWRKIK